MKISQTLMKYDGLHSLSLLHLLKYVPHAREQDQIRSQQERSIHSFMDLIFNQLGFLLTLHRSHQPSCQHQMMRSNWKDPSIHLIMQRDFWILQSQDPKNQPINKIRNNHFFLLKVTSPQKNNNESQRPLKVKLSRRITSLTQLK